MIALQRLVTPQDIAVATSTLGFLRQLGSAASIVIGGVIFQSRMQAKLPQLIAVLGPRNGELLDGSNAAANVQLVDTLPEAQKLFARQVFASSIQVMWYLFVALSALALVAAIFIG